MHCATALGLSCLARLGALNLIEVDMYLPQNAVTPGPHPALPQLEFGTMLQSISASVRRDDADRTGTCDSRAGYAAESAALLMEGGERVLRTARSSHARMR